MTLVLMLAFSLILISQLKLLLAQSQITHQFKAKLDVMNQAESLLQSLIAGTKPVGEGVWHDWQWDHQDNCLNQYYRSNIVVQDRLARARLKAVIVMPPKQIPLNCEHFRSRMIYQAFT